MNTKQTRNVRGQQDDTMHTPDQSITFNNQSSSSPLFQLSDMTPSTHLKFYQQVNANNQQTYYQQEEPRTYTNTIANGPPSEQMRDSTPKQMGKLNSGSHVMDSQRNSITPKIGRSPSTANKNLNPHVAQNDSESKSSFSYFQALQGSEMKTPGKQHTNQQNRISYQDQLDQISPVQKLEVSSPLVVRGDQDDLNLLVNSKLTSKKQKQKSGLKKSQANSKIGSKKQNQMTEKNKLLKEMMKQEEYHLQSNLKNQKSNELLNIKVQNNSQVHSSQQQSTTQNNQNLSSDVEVWRYTNNTGDRKDQQNQQYQNDQSFQDSDVADEFEYLYNPEYLNTRCMSPQTRNLYNNNLEIQNSANHQRSQSKTPNLSRINKSVRQQQLSPFKSNHGDFMRGLEEYEKYDLIKRTCKESTMNIEGQEYQRERDFKRKKNNFVNRMMIDVQARDNRDKTFDEIKYVVAMKTNHDQDSISRSVSPRKERSQNQRSQHDCTSHYQHTTQSPKSQMQNVNYFHSSNSQFSQNMKHSSLSPLRNHFNQGDQHQESTIVSMLLQSPQKKKLQKKDCIQIYNRLISYEQGRQQAISMLQEAKRKDEDAEYLQSTGNKKLTKKQKKQCYNRLMEDAQRRQVTMQKTQQQKVMLEEQSMRENQFKATKINQSIKKSNKVSMREEFRENQQIKNPQKPQNNREVEINVQKYYDQQHDLDDQYDQRLLHLQHQQQMYEKMQYDQYLLQQQEEQNYEDQQEIVNIQSDQNLVVQVHVDQRPESHYTSAGSLISDLNIDDDSSLNNQARVFQSPPNVSKPKHKMNSNALSGVKLSS
eukprot:403348244